MMSYPATQGGGGLNDLYYQSDDWRGRGLDQALQRLVERDQRREQEEEQRADDMAPPPSPSNDPPLLRVKRLEEEEDEEERLRPPAAGLQRMKRIDTMATIAMEELNHGSRRRRRRALNYDPQILIDQLMEYMRE
ncbi:hypothetical protein GBF38_015787 [Nibea albiflora]|uniref:Uncharacterized protein n=1 Tax=Nibea albiflora TaxID=240163 RepID=A0ACB7EMB7_NIBAL|nr:hypothetical protein GBF38_015787 [Nibea albiflora]